MALYEDRLSGSAKAALGLFGILLMGSAARFAVGRHAANKEGNKMDFAATGPSDMGAFVPKQGVNKVLVKPGNPGPLQFLPFMGGSKPSSANALFLYAGAIQYKLAIGIGSEEGWVYGAVLAPNANQASITGDPAHILKGRILTWDPPTFQEQLALADELMGYDPSHPNEVRREVVSVVRKDGSTTNAYWYYQVGNKPEKSSSRGQVIGPWKIPKIILNTEVTGAAPAPTDPMALVSELKMAMTTLKGEFIDMKGTRVDYSGIKQSKHYSDFLKTVSQLRSLSPPFLASLPVTQRRTFFINLYNCLCIHALVEGMLQPVLFSETLGRLKLYASASYQIGDQVLSLNDMENGILRNNRISAAPLASAPFSPADPRLALAVPLDPRIHFALNCGAKSCPPIAVYQADKLDKQLKMATESFLLSDDVQIVYEDNKVKLSMLFKWYMADFQENPDSKPLPSNLLRWIAKFLPKGTKRNQLLALRGTNDFADVKIEFLEYNWGLNSYKN
eukprot:gb/GEZN01006535.1/.p1 GENE.gb/GEZN01006535.1/~~gb/GEZN01006535.1/.p1  ORF type:complete len:504 (+),score=59.88 gb/GEZN01006535.1/:129-1640(+)